MPARREGSGPELQGEPDARLVHAEHGGRGLSDLIRPFLVPLRKRGRGDPPGRSAF